MSKHLQDYVKYTKAELDSYVNSQGSCVYKISNRMHFALLPYVLTDFKQALRAHITRHKVGRFDAQLNGIILDVKNIKVLSPVGALRSDDVRIHIDITAECYVFRPEKGALLCGKVKHIGRDYLGVIIYRVFNASVRLKARPQDYAIDLEQELQFYIKDFNIKSVFPYLQGELLKTAATAKPIKVNGFTVSSDTQTDQPKRIVTPTKLKTEFSAGEEGSLKSKRSKRKRLSEIQPELTTPTKSVIKVEPVETPREQKSARTKKKQIKPENAT